MAVPAARPRLNAVVVPDWSQFDAVLFDLDGVLTDTARLHATAWKVTFDQFLVDRHPHEPPFTIEGDYRTHVDGRPRYHGVDTFLRSRQIDLPWGSPDEPPSWDSVCGVGNRKNQLVADLIEREGVSVYPGSRLLIDHLMMLQMPMAVVTSSANATLVLRGAGLDEFFPVRVDGQVAARLGLRGKPDPDPYCKAAELLGVVPARAVVVEDAVSGITAGRRGGFGLVIGVDRHSQREALLEAGADVVVEDLAETVP